MIHKKKNACKNATQLIIFVAGAREPSPVQIYVNNISNLI
jgi:hypothetical protein